MNLSSKHAISIVLGIGILIILFGVIVAVFKVNIDSNVSNKVTSFLFIIAAALFFYSKSKKRKEEADKKEDLEISDEDDKDI
jgi:uncharacterized membrane protein YfcA